MLCICSVVLIIFKGLLFESTISTTNLLPHVRPNAVANRLVKIVNHQFCEGKSSILVDGKPNPSGQNSDSPIFESRRTSSR